MLSPSICVAGPFLYHSFCGAQAAEETNDLGICEMHFATPLFAEYSTLVSRRQVSFHKFQIIFFLHLFAKRRFVYFSQLVEGVHGYLFLPAKVFGSFSENFTVAYFRERYGIIIVSVALLTALHFLGKLTASY